MFHDAPFEAENKNKNCNNSESQMLCVVQFFPSFRHSCFQ